MSVTGLATFKICPFPAVVLILLGIEGYYHCPMMHSETGYIGAANEYESEQLVFMKTKKEKVNNTKTRCPSHGGP